MLTACKLDWSGSGQGKKGAFKDNGANVTVTPLSNICIQQPAHSSDMLLVAGGTNIT